MDRLQNEVNHNCRCGDEGRVVHGMRAHPRLHAARHEPLRLLNNHPVLLGDEKPTRSVLPKGTFYGDTDADRGDRSLHGREQRVLLTGCVLSKRRGERIGRELDEPMAVGCELRRLGVRCGSVKYVSDRLAFRGRKACHIDQ